MPDMEPGMEEAQAGKREGVSLCLVKSGEKQGREERGGENGRERKAQSHLKDKDRADKPSGGPSVTTQMRPSGEELRVLFSFPNRMAFQRTLRLP